MDRYTRYVSSAVSSDGCPRFVFEATRPCTVRDMLLSLGVSKAVVGRLFARGQLLIDECGAGSSDRPLAPQTGLSPGDRVMVECHPESSEVSSHNGVGTCGSMRNVQVRVLYEDPFVIAVDKPSGVLVHGDGTGAVTLSDAVADYCRRVRRGTCIQAIQRLDVDTTGVVLFSKTAEFQGLFDNLVAQKGNHGIEKSYLAIVQGRFSPHRTVFRDSIARDRHDARRMRVCTTGGQDALTEVECLGSSPDGSRSLVLVRLGTGRRHQIRVHLSAHGHPVENDPLYGTVKTASGLMLHAYRERFRHPVTGEFVDVCSGWPSRFDEWFDGASWQPRVLAAFDGSRAFPDGASERGGRSWTGRDRV